MANQEEANPLLQPRSDAVPKPEESSPPKPPPATAARRPPRWAANEPPVGRGSVVGEPVARNQWSSGLFSCLGRSDEFWSSDLDVCLVGSVAPCVLYGGNVERLGSGRGWFANSCFPYSTLFMLGNSLFGWNCLAPWFSYHIRTAIRRKFHLEGGFESFAKTCGCCHGILEDEEKLEQMETACDFATHYFCHPCSLCQEGRELRRRLPHPGFIGKPIWVTMAPGEQTMARRGA
ncbi:cell number regulator 8-like [Phoenix dactylifera]|uniref:Cell number regulator 8-like n=1 Tax=Phoenix dactylifera TaxID=42345 RepID=A0A8B7BXG1_PHODC|nr:cell number regulator 8-like [Phoenix dactylifera]